ncbi:hypothetical protein CEXT_713311 [Caerostris extrusa]|uniref:Uncharacterized protein n=1 Tax=Caerostris extrusa TaxID=172846 RepID=A0AAV4QLV3_CAEEX|nr:hypothetical protein CEXT_713311 [Caerostris extrusa]
MGRFHPQEGRSSSFWAAPTFILALTLSGSYEVICNHLSLNMHNLRVVYQRSETLWEGGESDITGKDPATGSDVLVEDGLD